MQIIRASGLAQSQWPNGAGRKADIASGPGWLIGFAWLEREAPFSDYAGHDRTITLVEGGGFTLDLPEGSVLRVDRPDTPAAFDGKGPITCRLLGGPCTVLNVVSTYPGLSHTVQVLSAHEVPAFEPGAHSFLGVLHGTVRAGNADAARLDTLILTSGEELRPSVDARFAAIRIESAGGTEEDEC